MKTRNGYVSNSSSSSFIIMDDLSIRHLTQDDWYLMLRDVFEDYEERMNENLVSSIREGWEYEDLLCVFDLQWNREWAIHKIGGFLEGRIASNASMKDGRISASKTDIGKAWGDFMYGTQDRIEVECNAHAHLPQNVGIDYYKSGKCTISPFGTGKEIPLPEKYVGMIEKKHNELGICDCLDVLRNPVSRFAMHFDDNECYHIKGMGSLEGYESEAGTYARLCEIFAEWFRKHGKLPEDFDWHNLLDLTLVVNMHEG